MRTPVWLFDELAHVGAEHLDAAYVSTYDPTRDVARLRALGLEPTSTLVDLGAGTGALALAAAPFCRRVVAVDVSAPMLDALRSQAGRRGLSNIECVRAGFLTYTHRGGPADVVCSRHALHHLPDFWKAIALTRVAGILRPGGVFWMRDLVYAFDPQDAGRVFEAWLAEAARRPDVGWTREELTTHIRDEHSTFTWLLEPMLERAGLLIRQREYSESRIYATYVCDRIG